MAKTGSSMATVPENVSIPDSSTGLPVPSSVATPPPTLSVGHSATLPGATLSGVPPPATPPTLSSHGAMLPSVPPPGATLPGVSPPALPALGAGVHQQQQSAVPALGAGVHQQQQSAVTDVPPLPSATMNTIFSDAAIYSDALAAFLRYPGYNYTQMAEFPQGTYPLALGFPRTPLPSHASTSSLPYGGTLPYSPTPPGFPPQQQQPPFYGAGQFTNTALPSIVTIAPAITIKLTSDNYMFWRAQVGPLLRGHMLMGYVDGSFVCPDPHVVVSHAGSLHSQPNPAHQHWIQQDQAILSGFVSSMTEGVLSMIMFAGTSRVAWETLSGAFASTSIARASALRQEMADLKKDNKTITVYFHQMKALSDSLTSIGMPLRDDEFISSLLAGLGEEYDALFEVVNARTTPMQIRDLFSQLQATEQRKLAQRRTHEGAAHYPAAPAASAPAGPVAAWTARGSPRPSAPPPKTAPPPTCFLTPTGIPFFIDNIIRTTQGLSGRVFGGSFTSKEVEARWDLLDRIEDNAEGWENDKGYADKPPFKPLLPEEGNEEKEEKKKKKGMKKKKKKKKKGNKKKEVTSYPRVYEITIGNRKYVAPNDYCDNESEYDDLPMPFTYISNHDLNEHTTFDIANLWETNSENDDDNNCHSVSAIHASSHNDIESSKLGEEVFANPLATGHYVLDTSPSNNNNGVDTDKPIVKDNYSISYDDTMPPISNDYYKECYDIDCIYKLYAHVYVRNQRPQSDSNWDNWRGRHSCADPVLPMISVMSGKLVQFSSDMITSTNVIVPVCINTIGSIVCIFVASVSMITTVVAITPPAVTGRMPMDSTDMEGGINIWSGLTFTTMPTIITSIAIITTARTVIVTTALIAASITAALVAATITSITVVATSTVVTALLAVAVVTALLAVVVVTTLPAVPVDEGSPRQCLRIVD
ncbi:hypothetical protein QYE76_026701 [Lolium multiflorum]|uniref:Retrotransposon Copia-like N-terminal domain-containing protein n=1 Tax=Lolium multiflorum TaxID=4521 RepID=A0AAD8VVU8_LOLMU|nr:hypothetical protein QYE76_026701 [Lolium multiflorum]